MDFIGAIPMSLIEIMINQSKSIEIVDYIKFIRLVKIVKLIQGFNLIQLFFRSKTGRF